jgi:hypothetical protein
VWLAKPYVNEECQNESGAALTIKNEIGSPITIGQFVSQVHEYVNENIDEVKNVKGRYYGKVETWEDGTSARVATYGQPYLPSDVAIFFSKVRATSVEDTVSMTISLFPAGEMGRSTDAFWQIQIRQAHARKQKN